MIGALLVEMPRRPIKPSFAAVSSNRRHSGRGRISDPVDWSSCNKRRTTAAPLLGPLVLPRLSPAFWSFGHLCSGTLDCSGMMPVISPTGSRGMGQRGVGCGGRGESQPAVALTS